MRSVNGECRGTFFLLLIGSSVSCPYYLYSKLPCITSQGFDGCLMTINMASSLPNKPFVCLFVFSFVFCLKYSEEMRTILKTQITHTTNDW